MRPRFARVVRRLASAALPPLEPVTAGREVRGAVPKNPTVGHEAVDSTAFMSADGVAVRLFATARRTSCSLFAAIYATIEPGGLVSEGMPIFGACVVLCGFRIAEAYFMSF